MTGIIMTIIVSLCWSAGVSPSFRATVLLDIHVARFRCTSADMPGSVGGVGDGGFGTLMSRQGFLCNDQHKCQQIYYTCITMGEG